MNIQDTLTKEDLKKFGKDLISFFLIPVAIVFLTSLQNGDIKLALGAAEGTAIACAINLLGKYKSGIEAPVKDEVIPVKEVANVVGN